MRTATVGRLVLGSALLAWPKPALELLDGPDADDASSRTVARVLGARLVLQAGLDVTAGPRTRRVDIVVDLVHAASMLPMAMVRPEHRRSALASAAAATTFAVLDSFAHDAA